METKIWFVTGASKGLGLSLVKQLLAAGQKVAATSRTKDELIKAVGITSENFLPLQVDLAEDDIVKKAIAKTLVTFGRIDVLINNAGYGIGGSLEELTDTEVRSAFDVNVFGTINTIRHTLPIMRKQRSGHIINIASIAGIGAVAGWAAYGAAKAAVIALTEVLAEDVKEFGITATAVAPGAFRTSFLTEESLVLAKNPIEEYSVIRESHKKYDAMNGNQAGDPEKAAAIMIQTAYNENPPVLLLLGSDAYRRANKKLDSLKDQYDALEGITKSTDY